MDRARPLYATDPKCLWFVFDLRCDDVAERLRRQLDAWRGSAHEERLNDTCVVLVVRPGGAAR